jgi:DNA helicase-2/ATP-dependent DNA helicase PcrA
VLERSGYLSALAADGTPEAETRVDNLKELVTSAEDFHAENTNLPAFEDGELERGEFELYLDQVALISDVDGYDARRDHVSLMTAHSAKGLEFPCVFMVGMEEGVFPHAGASRDDDGLEEERRLCYVGMTRAMERLTLSAARQRRRWGETSYQSPSRFLREIPSEIVEMEGAFGEAWRSQPAPTTQRRKKAADSNLDYSYSQDTGDDDSGIRKGMRVRHAVFGVGTIQGSRGEGLNTKIDIRFDKAGMKTIMVKYANLEPA